MTDWNPVIPGVVSVSTSHPEALVHKLADQVQASGHLTPQRLFFRNQKNVHGKEKSWWGQGYRIGRNGIHLSCVTLGKLLKLSEPQLSCILNRHHNASLKMLQ